MLELIIKPEGQYCCSLVKTDDSKDKSRGPIVVAGLGDGAVEVTSQFVSILDLEDHLLTVCWWLEDDEDGKLEDDQHVELFYAREKALPPLSPTGEIETKDASHSIKYESRREGAVNDGCSGRLRCPHEGLYVCRGGQSTATARNHC